MREYFILRARNVSFPYSLFCFLKALVLAVFDQVDNVGSCWRYRLSVAPIDPEKRIEEISKPSNTSRAPCEDV